MADTLAPALVVYTWEADNGARLDGAKSTAEAALTIREFARGYWVGIKDSGHLIARDPFTQTVVTWTGTPAIPGQRTAAQDDITAAMAQLANRPLTRIELGVIEDACRVDQDGSEQSARAALTRLRATLVARIPEGAL